MDQAYIPHSLVFSEISIKKNLARVSRRYEDCEHLGIWLSTLSSSFPDRAVLRFLVRGEIDGFVADLNRAALTFVTLLRAAEASLDVPAGLEGTRGELPDPMLWALAVGNFDLAAEIHRLLPSDEDEDLEPPWFAMTMAVRALIAGGQAQIEEALAEFREECEEEGEEQEEALLHVLEALGSREPERFASSLVDYLDLFEGVSAEDAELGPGQEFVSVVGLALCQLARKQGISFSVEHRMIPEELLNATPRVPTDGYPSWP